MHAARRARVGRLDVSDDREAHRPSSTEVFSCSDNADAVVWICFCPFCVHSRRLWLARSDAFSPEEWKGRDPGFQSSEPQSEYDRVIHSRSLFMGD